MLEASKYKILCVDDDPYILRLYEDILGDHLSPQQIGTEGVAVSLEQSQPESRWFEIVPAQSGEEAVDLVSEEARQGRRFAAGFFDMKMPGMNGLETIRRILEVDPDMHWAVVTGYSESWLKELNKAFPSTDTWLFLNKPFGRQELVQIAHHLVVACELRQENRLFTARLEEEVEKKTRKYKETADRLMLIHQFSKEIGSTFDLTDLLNNILDQLRLIVDADIGSLLLSEEKDYLTVKAAVGPHREEILGLKNEILQNRVSSHVVTTGTPVLVGGSDSGFFQASDQVRPDYDSFMSVPLFVKNKVIGVMNFGTTAQHKLFSHEELDFIRTIAGQIAVAIDNASLYRKLTISYDQLQNSYLLTIGALTNAIDAKDHYTHGHSQRVTSYSVAIAKELGLSDDDLDKLAKACILHDVGKIGIAESILNKPGGLSSEEWSIIRTHPAKGAEIIQDIPFLAEMKQVIYHHHERFDGRGYPDGIAGNEIPLKARIMAIADTLDAMTTNRPYRKGLDWTAAFAEIQRCAGTQFDPDVVRAFSELVRKGKIDLPE